MNRAFLLWATGQDRPGFVASITGHLFKLGCNLEDSSMMRLGSEFAMFVIFSSRKPIREVDFKSIKTLPDLNIGLKSLSHRLARFTPPKRDGFIVRVYGPDHTGIVYHVTRCLSKHRFNITDLSTHRTTGGKTPGYILLIEGELLHKKAISPLKKALRILEGKLKTKISFEPLTLQSF
jgi:glycine cleavage system transcriptional repressor